ncbi:MAG: GrpB family protein [bacterium]|nr:GrpB family protein [bacterium]
MSEAPNSKFTNYQGSWVKKFEEEKKKLLVVFGDLAIEIQHIGNTSIPGMSAKPIIDIAVLIESIDDIDKIVSMLNSLGYSYEPSMSSAERIFFRKGESVEYHVSVACPAHTFWLRQILFRDYLRSHSEFVKEYEELKNGNLKVTPEEDFEDLSFSEVYNRGKSEFVKKVLDLAEKEK